MIFIQSDAKSIYLNITTKEDKKLTVELSSCGFCIRADGKHNTIEKVSTEIYEDTVYFETPYSLLSSVSEGYDKSFGEALTNKLQDLKN